MRHTFKKDEKITSGDEIRTVLWKGRRFSIPIATIYYLPANNTKRRFTVIASKKFGGACERNRIRRLFKEVFRLNKEKLINGIDVLIKPILYSENFKYADAEKVFLTLCKKAGIVVA